MKICSKCLIEKSSKNFYKERDHSCKDCKKEINRKWHHRNAKKMSDQHRRYYKINSEKLIKNSTEYYKKNRKAVLPFGKQPKRKFYSYRYNAQLRNIKFNLSFEEFKSFWQKPCYYCHDVIETIGLDRVDNDSGYVFRNIVSCCIICNKMKLKLSSEEFLNHVSRIASTHGVVRLS